MTAEQMLHYLSPERPVSQEEKKRRFYQGLETAIWQAERARSHAHSYRDFRVGAAVEAFRDDALSFPHRFRSFYGINTKILKERRPICAEPIALSSALASGYTEAIGLVIIGEPQEDEHGLLHKTLRPCRECRLFMKEHPLMRPETIIITARPPQEECAIIFEEHTLEELLKAYGES
ncbi:hypothetical protein L0Y46_01975 [bacterium]|nr:hypothetical protein [bacterium]